MTLVTQTKAPNPNTNIKPIFCFLGSCSCFKSGIGMEKIKISVAMLSAALENQNAVFSMQCTVMPVFQKFETGTHMKVEPVQS